MEDVENLSSFGRNVGIAFQLIDDLIGIIGDPKVTGKAVGNDIREGKNTYPILLALNHARGENKDKILKVFRSKDASSTDLDEADQNHFCHWHRSICERMLPKAHIDRAIKSIENYDNSDAKKALESSAKFIVERSM